MQPGLRKPGFIIFFMFLFSAGMGQSQRPLRIIAFGAHPDDAELRVGGMATKWAAKGHKVKLVAMTNGDVGHFESSGGALAIRRTKEVQECARLFGIETEVMDIHDGELEPSLENRKKVSRLIREWQADVVLAHRPNDYHPDHRYVGELVQDAAVVVAAPFFTPDTKPTQRNPVFLFYSDNFNKPTPFDPTIIVSIDEVADTKWNCISAMSSQFSDLHSWQASTLPGIPKDDQGRAAFILNIVKQWSADVAIKYRNRLIELHGPDKGSKVKYAEAFELCQYGRQASVDELKEIFLLDNKIPANANRVYPAPDESVRLSAWLANSGSGSYSPSVSAYENLSPGNKILWSAEVKKAGDYEVFIEWAAMTDQEENFILKSGKQSLSGTIESTGSDKSFISRSVGKMQLKTGMNTLIFAFTGNKTNGSKNRTLLSLREIRLKPMLISN